MRSPCRRALGALALTLFVAATAAAQQLPDVSAGARIRVKVAPVGRRGDGRTEVAYVTRLDADSLAYRSDRTGAVAAVPWARVSTLEVSEGVRTTPLSTHAFNAGALSALGAAMGWWAWHDCRDPEKDYRIGCILTVGRLGTATEGGAALGAGLAVVISLNNLRRERWRDVSTPGTVRLSIRPAGGGIGVGLKVAF